MVVSPFTHTSHVPRPVTEKVPIGKKATHKVSTEKVPTWRQIAAEQDNVLARYQALARGMTKSAWDWRVARGGWQSPMPGIAVLHSGVLQPRELRWVAVLRAGRGAALSGDAGLLEWGVKRLTLSALDVAVPRPRHLRVTKTSSGLSVVTHRLVTSDDLVTEHNSLPTVVVHLAALHAAAWAPSDRAAELRLALVVQQRMTTAPLMRTALGAMPKHPRRKLLLEVLDDLELGAHALGELDFLRFCRRHDLPEPDELQVLVRAGGKRYLDGCYRKQRISVEVDGAYHAWVEQWDADSLRSLNLAVVARGTGEQRIRLTGANLRHDEAEVAGLLRQLLV